MVTMSQSGQRSYELALKVDFCVMERILRSLDISRVIMKLLEEFNRMGEKSVGICVRFERTFVS